MDVAIDRTLIQIGVKFNTLKSRRNSRSSSSGNTLSWTNTLTGKVGGAKTTVLRGLGRRQSHSQSSLLSLVNPTEFSLVD